MTCRLVDPTSSPWNPPLPREPRTSRPAEELRATSASRGLASTTSLPTSRPGCRAATRSATIRSASSPAPRAARASSDSGAWSGSHSHAWTRRRLIPRDWASSAAQSTAAPALSGSSTPTITGYAMTRSFAGSPFAADMRRAGPAEALLGAGNAALLPLPYCRSSDGGPAPATGTDYRHRRPSAGRTPGVRESAGAPGGADRGAGGGALRAGTCADTHVRHAAESTG